jgi:16S rRNA (guanine527-N7)-methyltransferase
LTRAAGPLAARWGAKLQAGAGTLGVALAPGQIEQLFDFVAALERWNRVYNLSGVRDPDQMVVLHLLDSLSVGPWLGGSPVLDVGTGAGLPGVPLAIAYPQRRFVLLDGNSKKLRFVTQTLFDLGLRNVSAVPARIEAYRPAEKFATIVSRAVGSALDLFALAAPLLEPGGRMLLMKGRPPEQDLQALAAAGIPCRLQLLAVPFLEQERHLIEIGPVRV